MCLCKFMWYYQSLTVHPSILLISTHILLPNPPFLCTLFPFITSRCIAPFSSPLLPSHLLPLTVLPYPPPLSPFTPLPNPLPPSLPPPSLAPSPDLHQLSSCSSRSVRRCVWGQSHRSWGHNPQRRGHSSLRGLCGSPDKAHTSLA